MNLTIAYVTARQEPCFYWFFESLVNQLAGRSVSVVVIDFFSDDRNICSAYYNGPWLETKERLRGFINVYPPKPNVWNGRHRLTKENWFAMSNARNTALCLCDTDWIAYVDDLSVLLPGWLDHAFEATSRAGTITLGAYQKVKRLFVERGLVKSFEDYPAGHDNRLNVGNRPRYCRGEWLYGCSLVAPVSALMAVDGWPEYCDGMGFEDCIMGVVLENAGFKFFYDPNMMTYESEELHHVGPKFRKEDWHFENGAPVIGGNGKDDKSHAALNIARQSKRFDNGFGDGGITGLRRRILAGEPFPVKQTPEHEWYSKTPLANL